MRGEDQRSEVFFSATSASRPAIASDHPLRAVRALVDEALTGLFARLQQALRARRPAVDPAGAACLRALLLQAFYTVRSERQLMEQLNYNLLFRWFVGLSADDPVWDATVFCKKPGSAARRRYRGQVLCERAEPASS